MGVILWVCWVVNPEDDERVSDGGPFVVATAELWNNSFRSSL